MSQPTKRTRTLGNSATVAVGTCPICSAEVDAIGNLFRCKRYISEECDFFLRRTCLASLGKSSISNEEMAVLLKGNVINLDDLLRKDGERFSCGGILDYNDRTGWWGICFVRRRAKRSSPGLPDRRRKVGAGEHEKK